MVVSEYIDPEKRPDMGAKVIAILTAIGSLVGVLLAWAGDNSSFFHPPGGSPITILLWAAPFITSLAGALTAWYLHVKPKVTPVDDPAKRVETGGGFSKLVRLVPDPAQYQKYNTPS